VSEGLSAAEELDVAAARRGDRAAFERLYARHARAVHGVLLAHVARADADDLMMDTFVTALEKLPGLKDAPAVGPWLSAIARNKALDFLRARPRAQALALGMRVASEGASPAPTDARAEAAQVLAVIRTLPEAYREPLALRLVEGLSGPEIAEQTGLTPDSVRVNLCRGFKLLREKLGEEAFK
jgi:RNA polymerase sigma-70 factor, ECF subfamily